MYLYILELNEIFSVRVHTVAARSVAEQPRLLHRRTVGPNCKKTAKNKILKIHEIDWSYSTSFEYETLTPETEIVVIFAEICLKKLVKSHQMNLFCRRF